ncbi:MAG: ribbon-helix-helix protein, CopG family [Acidobacteriia bacterium]|nr:ribbon-helix-helix protein, CopG family [Terriglobia bacterium]
MKTAISIPDDLFRSAEWLARRTGKSRSRLFSDAVREYLARHVDEEVTEAMDRACAEAGSEAADPFVSSAARRILERSEWSLSSFANCSDSGGRRRPPRRMPSCPTGV